MAYEFEAFLAENVEKAKTEEYVVTDRIKDSEGNPIPWTLRPIDAGLDARIRKASMVSLPIPGKKGMRERQMDTNTYMCKLAVASILKPDLNNVQLQGSYGCMDPEDLLRKMLTAGEIQNLYLKVEEINGFDHDLDEAVEEAKN